MGEPTGKDAEIASAVVERARRGDPEAFAAVVRHYDSGLRALAYRLLGDRDRMDDALQEAYVNAYRALPDLRGASKLGTWLYRIAYNACVNELERSRRVIPFPLGEMGEQPDSSTEVAEIAASKWDLAAALVVRGGVFGSRIEIVPVEEVDGVEPRRKRLQVRNG